MTTPQTPIRALLVCAGFTLAMTTVSPAAATAGMGGVVSLVGGAGNCNVSALVPQDTPQDSFLLSRVTGCNGTSAAAEIRGSAATASVGMRAASSGNGRGNSQAAAQVSLSDRWLISVPAGTALGPLTLPVSLHLEGNVSPGAFADFGLFLQYMLNIGLPSSSNVFIVNGNVTTTGAFAQTFNSTITWNYTGAPLPVAIGLNLRMPGMFEGALDFYNSAGASIQLPAGYSATTLSGLPLMFAPVPEPSSASLLAAALAVVLLSPRLRRSVPRVVRR